MEKVETQCFPKTLVLFGSGAFDWRVPGHFNIRMAGKYIHEQSEIERSKYDITELHHYYLGPIFERAMTINHRPTKVPCPLLPHRYRDQCLTMYCLDDLSRVSSDHLEKYCKAVCRVAIYEKVTAVITADMLSLPTDGLSDHHVSGRFVNEYYSRYPWHQSPSERVTARN